MSGETRMYPVARGRPRTREPLGYELTSRRLQSPLGSHGCRSSTVSRPSCLAPSRLFASVPPCSVSKSVANTARSKVQQPRRLTAVTRELRRLETRA